MVTSLNLIKSQDKVKVDDTWCKKWEGINLPFYFGEINAKILDTVSGDISSEIKNKYNIYYKLCYYSKSLPEMLHDLSQYHWSEQIVSHVKSLVEIIVKEEIEEEHFPVFCNEVTKQIDRLMSYAIELSETNSIYKLNIDRYALDTVRNWALIRVESEKPLGEIGHIDNQYCKLVEFTWMSDLLKTAKPNSMYHGHNYNYPELFSYNTFLFLLNSYNESYKEYDSNLMRVLMDKMPSFLVSKHSTFYNLVKKDGTTIATIWKVIEKDGTRKIVSMYISPEYRSYWVGKYLLKIAWFETGCCYATISVFNPNLEYFLEKLDGFYLTGFIDEHCTIIDKNWEEKQIKSDIMFKLEYDSEKHNNKTKKTRRTNLHSLIWSIHEEEHITVDFDMKSTESRAQIQGLFNQGYVISGGINKKNMPYGFRFFFERLSEDEL